MGNYSISVHSDRAVVKPISVTTVVMNYEKPFLLFNFYFLKKDIFHGHICRACFSDPLNCQWHWMEIYIKAGLKILIFLAECFVSWLNSPWRASKQGSGSVGYLRRKKVYCIAQCE